MKNIVSSWRKVLIKVKIQNFPELFLKKDKEFANSGQTSRPNISYIKDFLAKYHTKIASKNLDFIIFEKSPSQIRIT